MGRICILFFGAVLPGVAFSAPPFGSEYEIRAAYVLHQVATGATPQLACERASVVFDLDCALQNNQGDIEVRLTRGGLEMTLLQTILITTK